MRYAHNNTVIRFEGIKASRKMRELWEGIYSSGQFNEDALDYYFDEWVDRFFLLGERPFFQVPGLQYVGSKPYSPVSEIDCGRAQA